MSEVKIPVNGSKVDAVLVFDTDDIEAARFGVRYPFTEGVSKNGGVTRTHTGEALLDMHIRFKNGKRPRFEEKK